MKEGLNVESSRGFSLEDFNNLSMEEQHKKAAGLKGLAFSKLSEDERDAVYLDEQRMERIYDDVVKGDYFKLDQENKNNMDIYLMHFSGGITKLLLLAREGKLDISEEEMQKLISDFTGRFFGHFNSMHANPETLVPAIKEFLDKTEYKK